MSCWGTGELKQLRRVRPGAPASRWGRCGSAGSSGGRPHPAAPGEPLAGGPQMVEVSRDGRRVYLTNSLYGAWDDQFYPDGVGAWMAKIDADPRPAGCDRPGVLPARRRRSAGCGLTKCGCKAGTHPPTPTATAEARPAGISRRPLEQRDEVVGRFGRVERHDRHVPLGTAVVDLDGEVPRVLGVQPAEARVVVVLTEIDLDEPLIGEVRGELGEVGRRVVGGLGRIGLHGIDERHAAKGRRTRTSPAATLDAQGPPNRRRAPDRGEEREQAGAFLEHLGAVGRTAAAARAGRETMASPSRRRPRSPGRGRRRAPSRTIHRARPAAGRDPPDANPRAVGVREQHVVVLGEEADGCRSVRVGQRPVGDVDQLDAVLGAESAQPEPSRSTTSRSRVSPHHAWMSRTDAGPKAPRYRSTTTSSEAGGATTAPATRRPSSSPPPTRRSRDRAAAAAPRAPSS